MKFDTGCIHYNLSSKYYVWPH